MVDHGFIGAKAGSRLDVDAIALAVSEISGVIFVHVVEGPRYNIIVEIDPREHKKKHQELVEDIYRIEGIHKEKADSWRILRSFRRGKKAEKKEAK